MYLKRGEKVYTWKLHHPFNGNKRRISYNSIPACSIIPLLIVGPDGLSSKEIKNDDAKSLGRIDHDWSVNYKSIKFNSDDIRVK